jgi:hypothetical protein
MVFHAWTSPDIGYVAGDPSHARSMRLLPITFPAGGHNPQIG